VTSSCHPQALSMARSALSSIVLLLGACTASYHMGDPLTANPSEPVPQASPAPAAVAPADTNAEYRSGNAQQEADQWELKWQQIQTPRDTVSWSDHFQVCGLKYRFRQYDQFFRCLDLLDAKIAAGGPRVPEASMVRQGAPVMSGWLRASAYAELGDPDTALKWAESAWAALPAAYRTADPSIGKGHVFGGIRADQKPLYFVADALGSRGWGNMTTEDEEGMDREGRNNPAALDFRPPMVAMALTVQRALLYQRLGKPDRAKAALADLKRWGALRLKDDFNLFSAGSRPFAGRAQLLSIGPLFAQGDYALVVAYYEPIARQVASARRRESAMHTVDWTLFLPYTLFEKGVRTALTAPFYGRMHPSDARLFSIAVEDVSNALLYAQSLSRLGSTEQAAAMFDTLLALPEIRAMGNLYWVALYERGLIALEEGHSEQGIGLLVQSVDAIESVRSTISFEAAKIGFAGDKQTVYAILIGALAESGDWRQAFLYTERAKARALVDLLAQREDLAPPPSVDDKVRELFARAATVDTGVGYAATDETARGIKLIADSRDALATAAPEAASLISVQKVDIPDISARISADESLVEYYSQGNELYAFVLHDGAIKGYPLSARGLATEVRAFREAIARRDPQAMDLGKGLYDRLVRPLLPDLKGTRLVIAPHGVLHYLPFAALDDGERYLLDQFSLRLIPSASTLLYLRTEQSKKAGKLLALGNPDLGERAYDLPNAQVEAVQVAAMFPDSRALVRADASKSAVKQLGNGFSILHFATHGKFDANAPLSSGLYLAKGSEANGVLTVSDLYSLRWDVDLVTLSACETGLGQIANGDDVIGLTRGFLYAGARSIVASLWEVDDAATEQLMVSFYRNLEKSDKSEALRLAQIETRQHYPQPWYWAAFNVMGRAD
jgi:CHAT domain-containing protein